MARRLWSVGLLVCGIGLSVQAANAQQWGQQQWGQWNSGCTPAPAGPGPANWHGPMSYQPPAPMQGPRAGQPATGQPATGQPAQGRAHGTTNYPAPATQGQTAQFNNQTYQSFSAEPQPAPAYSYGPAMGYSYPQYGGYYGSGNYGSPYNGGSYYGGYASPSYNTTNGRFDNANNHGINPANYP